MGTVADFCIVQYAEELIHIFTSAYMTTPFWLQKEVRTASPMANEIDLVDLIPYTRYEVKIRAENSFGQSEVSESLYATTYEDTPSESPNNVAAFVDGRRRVTLMWGVVSENGTNGVIVGYRVYFPFLKNLERIFESFTFQSPKSAVEQPWR